MAILSARHRFQNHMNYGGITSSRLVLSILSDAEERFQVFLVLTHSALCTCSQFNNHLYCQLTKPDTGTSLSVKMAKLPYHSEVLLLVCVLLSLLCPLKMLHIYRFTQQQQWVIRVKVRVIFRTTPKC